LLPYLVRSHTKSNSGSEDASRLSFPDAITTLTRGILVTSTLFSELLKARKEAELHNLRLYRIRLVDNIGELVPSIKQNAGLQRMAQWLPKQYYCSTSVWKTITTPYQTLKPDWWMFPGRACQLPELGARSWLNSAQLSTFSTPTTQLSSETWKNSQTKTLLHHCAWYIKYSAAANLNVIVAYDAQTKELEIEHGRGLQLVRRAQKQSEST
jgi:hypothetical protein